MKIPQDKKLHFGAGLVISLLYGYLMNPLTGIATAVLAGIAKECYDYVDYGEFDFMDCLATWVGGVAGYIVALLVNTL